MQEEIEHKTVNFAISTAKLSARTLLRGAQFFLRQYDKSASQGKQSMKRLIRQNRGVTNLEIEKTGIKDFDRCAKRYHIDYAIQKDLSCTPPRFLIFFKAQDSERAYVDNTQPIFVTEDDEDSVDFKRYEKAITVTDVYHETKNRFAWVGEIKNEHLLAALEKLNAKDLELLTLFAYEGYTVTEISKVLHCSQPTISIKIKRITKFLKNFEFDAMD